MVSNSIKTETMCFMKTVHVLLTFLACHFSLSRCFDLDGSSESYGKFSPWQPCSNGSVSFQFKTPLKNALLFYADGMGDDDYYELKLVNGIVNLRFKLQNERAMLSNGQNLGDDQWHTVDILREGHLTTLRVDGLSYTTEHQTFDHSDDNFDVADGKFVYIGGVPKISKHFILQNVIHELHFRGSIQNLFFASCGKPLTRPEDMGSKGMRLENDECLNNNPCRNTGICVMRENGIQCDCSWTDYTGKFCEMEKLPMEAMFQGTQYLSYDLSSGGEPIFSGRDVLSMKFKTTYSNGLMFYTGHEDKDHMTISLRNGAIHVTMELGSGEFSEVVDMDGYKLDDGQWHQLVVTRDSREIKIEIDGAERGSGTTIGDFDKLSSNIIYIGGSSRTHSIPGTDITENFRGCMKQVEYTADAMKLELIELASKTDPLITVFGDVTFGQCEEVIESQPITFTTPESFIALARFDVSKKIATINFQFKTVEANSLIMYNGGSFGNINSDFFALEIIDGYFYLLLDLGSGSIKERASRTRVDDGSHHSVLFHYGGKKGFIKVDNHHTEYTTPGHRSQLELEQLLFVGGLDFHRHNSYRLPKQLWSGILKYGFVGCLQDLIVNNVKVDLMTVARTQRQRDIVTGCVRSESQCSSQPCMHKGKCVEGWNRFTCDCRATEYTGKTCEQVAATLSFDGAQYVLISLHEESFTEAEDISIRFRTMRSSGLLMMTASSQVSDSIEMYLENGAFKFTINLGTQFKTLSFSQPLNDDQWHTVFMKRRGQNLELNVDQDRPISYIIPHVASTIRMTQIVLGSAGPMMSDTYGPSTSDISFDDMKAPLLMQRDARVQHTGFVGAMQQFLFNGIQYFDMAKSENHENIEITARFDNGESVTRDPVTFESRDSYVILPQLKANRHFTIYFKFKTSEKTGIILFNGRHGSDFLALELYKGFLYYIYDMGAGSQRLRINTPTPLSDNKWHDVSLLRPTTEKQIIRVDNNPPTIENMRDSPARRFDLTGPCYLGGVVKPLYNSLPVQVLARYGFLGCLASLEINGRPINILTTANSIEHSVVAGCSSSEMTCHANSCFNGGRCVLQWHSYVCDCDMTSFTGPACLDDSVTYRFGMNKGLITFEYEENLRPSTNSDTLALGIKTIKDYGVLVRVDSADTDDYIQMELIEGNVMVLYNMGQHNTPIAEAYAKLNDNKYHVIKFKRLGANATLQVDNFDTAFKYPMDTRMTVFNDQARVWIGGHKSSNGKIDHAFHGIISGLFFNGHRILDYLKDGDPRVTSEGDITLVHKSDDELGPPELIENNPNIQSTQGFKVQHKNKRSAKPRERQARRKEKFKQSKKITQNFQPFQSFLSNRNVNNSISKHKPGHKDDPYDKTVYRNTAQNENNHSSTDPHSDGGLNDINNATDEREILISGDLNEPSNNWTVYKNDETNIETPGNPLFGSKDITDDDEDLKPYIAEEFITAKENYFKKLFKVYKISNVNFEKKSDIPIPNVMVEKLHRTPFTKQYRFSKDSYPKDRGKPDKDNKRKQEIAQGKHDSKHKLHSSGTTPRQTVTDDIIHSSGNGLDECISDDEEQCLHPEPQPTDEIITPTIRITRQNTTTLPVKPPKKNNNKTITCKGPECKSQNTRIFPPEVNTPTSNLNPETNEEDGQNLEDVPKDGHAKHKKDNGHLNIFLIIGIVAGILVALIIIAIAFYKFRNREEGSYRVDESQNFAYLEAKKQQSNGSAVNNVGNGKVGGKKKDVKEWYV